MGDVGAPFGQSTGKVLSPYTDLGGKRNHSLPMFKSLRRGQVRDFSENTSKPEFERDR